MIAYSIPLCTIFTKCPASPGPMNATHFPPSPSSAAIFSNNSFSSLNALSSPPGIMLGPFSAPSSPPETPMPRNLNPFSSTSFTRLSVSGKWLFPPSIKMSSLERMGVRELMTASTASPAFTMMRIGRGGSSELTSSSSVLHETKSPSDEYCFMNSSVFSVVLL